MGFVIAPSYHQPGYVALQEWVMNSTTCKVCRHTAWSEIPRKFERDRRAGLERWREATCFCENRCPGEARNH